jgi:hypothetical protein
MPRLSSTRMAIESRLSLTNRSGLHCFFNPLRETSFGSRESHAKPQRRQEMQGSMPPNENPNLSAENPGDTWRLRRLHMR